MKLSLSIATAVFLYAAPAHAAQRGGRRVLELLDRLACAVDPVAYVLVVPDGVALEDRLASSQ